MQNVKIIISFLLVLTMCLILAIACKTNEAGVVKPVIKSDMPKTLRTGSIAGKGLNEYATLKIEPEVFFETSAKIRSAVLAERGKLYFGNEKCEFYAVDIATKQMLWKYTSDLAVQTRPVITVGKIIFNAGNSLYILDSANGNELYKVTYESKRQIRMSSDSYAYNDTYTAVVDGVAYYTALDGTLVAVDIIKGEIIWTVPYRVSGYATSGVNHYNGRLYYVDNNGSLCCVDIESKSMIFQTLIGNQIYAPMHISGGKIYLAGRNCRINCIDATDGEVIWLSFSNDITTWFSGGSVSVGGTLYTCTSDEHTIVAFNKDSGEFIRIYPTETNAYTQPVLNGNNIVVAATDVYSLRRSNIMEFDVKNHTKIWQAQLNDAVLSSPAIYQRVLYFGSDSGKVYSIVLPVKDN